MQPTTHSPLRTALRVAIGIVIIIVLIFLSIWIVRVIPRLISSIIGGGSVATTTPNPTATSTNTGGFIIIDNNSSSTNATTTYNWPNNNSNNNSNNVGYTPPPAGNPDLSVTITSRGIINPANGAFIETSNITSADTVVVKFKIENRGTAPTGIWNLTVSMPTNKTSDQLRTVNGNRSIPPGVAITGSTVFSNARLGFNSVIITADPSRSIADSNRTNNTATAGFNVTAGVTYNGGGAGGNIPNGTADLSIQSSQVGTLDQNNRFIPTYTVPVYGRAAVQFKVLNLGNNSSSYLPWSFRAEMTDYPNINKIYNSEVQPGLVGGQSVTYTVGFDNVTRGQNSITVYIDSQNMVPELNENNNWVNASFTVN